MAEENVLFTLRSTIMTLNGCCHRKADPGKDEYHFDLIMQMGNCYRKLM